MVLSRYVPLLCHVLNAADILLQDRYADHFGLDRRSVENAAKRVQDGARNVLDRN